MIRLIVLLLCASVLSACTSIPTDQFKTFSTAATALNTSSASTYQNIQVIAQDTTILIAPDAPITPTSFLVDAKKFDPSGFIKTMAARLDLVAKYAAALDVLATGDTTANIDSASKSLAASLTTLSKDPSLAATATKHGITTATINDANTLADTLARAVTAYERKSAITDMLSKGQPVMHDLADEIAAQSVLLVEYTNFARDRYLEVFNKKGGRAEYGSYARYQENTDVAVHLKIYVDTANDADAMNKAAAQLPELVVKLQSALTDPATSRASLSEFWSQAKQLHSFYTGLPTK